MGSPMGAIFNTAMCSGLRLSTSRFGATSVRDRFGLDTGANTFQHTCVSLPTHTLRSDDMKKPTRREQKRLETTERILDAAMQLLTEDGYEAFTIARLARELNYAVGALYRYFKGKDAILAALQLRIVDRIDRDLAVVGELVERRVVRDTLDSKTAAVLHVWASIGVYESLTRRHPMHHKLLSLSLGDPRELIANEVVDAGVLEPLGQVLGRLTARLDQAVEVGAFVPGEGRQRTMVLWGSSQGVMQLRKLGRFEPLLGDRALADGGTATGTTTTELTVTALIISENAPIIRQELNLLIPHTKVCRE